MVLSAEVMPILRCAEQLSSKNMTLRTVCIFLESMVVIAALAKSTAESALFWECMQVL
jgi:hypothetical protein